MRISAALLALLCALVSTAQGQMVQDMVDALVRLSPPSLERAGKTLAYEFSSEEIDGPFTGIALQGLASGDTLSGQVRFGSSQAWVPLYIVRSATDAAFLAAYRGTVLHTRQIFTLRFSIGQADSLSILAAGVFSALHEEEPGQTGHGIRGRGSAIIAPALINPPRLGCCALHRHAAAIEQAELCGYDAPPHGRLFGCYAHGRHRTGEANPGLSSKRPGLAGHWLPVSDGSRGKIVSGTPFY